MNPSEDRKRSRTVRRMTKRVEKTLQGKLKPGEELKVCFWARKYVNLAFAFLVGHLWYMIRSTSHYVTASEERVFLLSSSGLSQKPKKVVFVDEIASVTLAKYSSRSASRYTLKHKGEEKPYELRLSRPYWKEAEALISLLRAAREGTAAKSLATSYRKLS